MGPVTPFFPSMPNFPKCPPPVFPNVQLAWRQPPTHRSYRLTSPLAPIRARPEAEAESSRVDPGILPSQNAHSLPTPPPSSPNLAG